MAGEVKIGVSAGVQGVDAAIQKITSSMNKLGAAVAKSQGMKFEDTSVKLMARDLALVNKQFQQTLALSAQVRNALKNSGQSGLHISQIDWSKTSIDPRAAQRMRDRAFINSVRGTSLDPTIANEVGNNGDIVPPGAGGAGGGSGAGGSAGGSGGAGGGGGGRRPPRGAGGASGGAGEGGEGGGGSWWRRRQQGGFGTATALAIGNGIGGTAGDLVTAAAGGGGLPGVGLTALTAAIGKAISFASEGMDLAKQQNEAADILKRSMGDLGVSFKELTGDSRYFGQQIGVAGGEFLKLEEQANSASGGLYRTPAELAAATVSGGDLARAYGLQPSQGVNFVAGMDRLNNRQNNKELATALAEAIINAQGKATPGEVMQMMQGFAASQNAFNAVNPNLNMFGNAIGSMLGSDTMMADHASGILGQANSAMQHMGGTEASKNFLMQQFGLDPISAQARAEGGLFANGLDNPDYQEFFKRRGYDISKENRGPAGSNLDVTIAGLDKAYAGRGEAGRKMELNAIQNVFGLKSLGDAAALADAAGGNSHNGIAMVLKNAGVNLSDVREGGLQAISAISKAGDFNSLDALYRNGPDAIRNRSDMSDDDKKRLDAAEHSNNFQQMQDALVRTLAGKGQADDDASTQRSIDANIENMKSNIGSYLVPYSQKAMEGILWMANKLGAGIADPNKGNVYDADKLSQHQNGDTAPNGYGDGPTAVGGNKGIVVNPGGTSASGGSTMGGRGDARMIHGNGGPSFAGMAKDAFYGGRRAIYDTRLTGLEQQYGLPGGLLDGVWGAETSWGRNNRTSGAGAKGNFQMLDGTARQYGVQIGDFSSESDGAARMYRDLFKANHGNLDKTLAAYNWGQGNLNKDIAAHGDDWLKFAPKETRDYIQKIEKSMKDNGGVASGAQGDTNIVVNVHPTLSGARTKTLSAKIPKPSAAGSRNQNIKVSG